MVQVWDWDSRSVDERLTLHGKVGYLVKDHTTGTDKGLVWEVIFFDGSEPLKQVINTDWLVKINTSKDIKKKT